MLTSKFCRNFVQTWICVNQCNYEHMYVPNRTPHTNYNQTHDSIWHFSTRNFFSALRCVSFARMTVICCTNTEKLTIPLLLCNPLHNSAGWVTWRTAEPVLWQSFCCETALQGTLELVVVTEWTGRLLKPSHACIMEASVISWQETLNYLRILRRNSTS